MTCNDKCIHYSVCEQKKYDFANIDECMYYATKFEKMLEKEEKADKKCRCCGITYPNEHLEKIILGKHYLKLCPNCYSEFSKIFYPKKEDVFTRKEELSKEESEWLIDFIMEDGNAE